MKKDSIKGFSLLELLLVVSIGSVLLLSGLAVYRLVSNQEKVNSARTLVGAIVAQAEGKLDVGDLDPYPQNTDITDIFIDLQMIPNGYLGPAGTAFHPWGGRLIIEKGAGASLGAGASDYKIEFRDVEDLSLCIELGQAFDFDTNQGVFQYRLQGVVVNDTTLAGLSAACSAQATPFIVGFAVIL